MSQKKMRFFKQELILLWTAPQSSQRAFEMLVILFQPNVHDTRICKIHYTGSICESTIG